MKRKCVICGTSPLPSQSLFFCSGRCFGIDLSRYHGWSGWTEEAVGLLTALWAEGRPTKEIAQRIGTTKNAVVGKAYNLNLPLHQSSHKRTAA